MPEIFPSTDLIETGTCAFCSGRQSRPLARRSDGLPIHECADCGLAYIDPRPSVAALDRYYDSGYFLGQRDFFRGSDYCAERDRAISEGGVTAFREITTNFDLGAKAILDIGCASGALLRSLQPYAPKQLTGIDLSEYPVNYGRSKYGLDLRCTTLENARFPDHSFDIVTMIDVIEHLYELAPFLAELRRILAPGGRVYLSTPNFGSFPVAKTDWVGLTQDFEHLHYLSPVSLAEISRRSSFRVDKVWTFGCPSIIRQYPKLKKGGLHRILYARTALSNLRAKRRFARQERRDPLCGFNLCAILAPL